MTMYAVITARLRKIVKENANMVHKCKTKMLMTSIVRDISIIRGM
jgi:hypothetical protein